MKRSFFFLLIFLAAVLGSGCEDKLHWIKIPERPPEVEGISPESGPPGTEVVVTGKAFSSVPENNTVTFNGEPALVSSASKTELIVVAPEDGSTGPVAIQVNGKMAAKKFIFTYE